MTVDNKLEGEGLVAYPWSVVGYFALGCVGAFAFLALSLMFEKGFSILPVLPLAEAGSPEKMREMTRRLYTHGAVYVALGGALAIVLNVAGAPDFGPNEYAIAFATGAGWPAIMQGISAGKQISEVKQARQQDIATVDERLSGEHEDEIAKVQGVFERRLEAMQQMLNDKDERVREVTEYFTRRLSKLPGGGP